MFETIKNAWKIGDLKKKLLVTVGLLLIYRLGSHLPVPGLIAEAFEAMTQGNQLFGFMDTFSGGAFSRASLFAMNITPYINASIIMNLLTVAIPALERMQKEGTEGRKKIQQIVRYLAVALGFFQAAMLYISLANNNAIYDGGSIISFFIITLSFTAGTAFIMWLGENITEYGIGNGISLIIFAGILARAPQGVAQIWTYYQGGFFGTGILAILAMAAIFAVFVVSIVGVIYVTQAERKVPVQYAKRVVGRKMYGGQSTHLPMKVNMAGVIPIIFATSITTLPSIIIGLAAPNTTNTFLLALQKQGGVAHMTIMAILIIFFAFFYTIIQFNPVEVANNMKKNGGFIPGIRPGKPTADYIAKVLNRITWFGGFFLAAVAVFPQILGAVFNINIWFGGTALLIVVGVALDTVKQIESQMLMRHYKGFLD
ncbi:MAG TPA: preprotein translocase subunit SecY [Clostridia bacterium]|jgi:preprotein translocase subunit SecY|nr:preprotein translocase subunit SecY [Clostridia bacterium]HPQ46062.1 preprotein translocase subunit SecY [Clostridia bacterium]HRX43611.1 preprotein translocase subunit SecY [Clostridia bacterium]